jgi:hypothetical protein
MTEFKTCFQPFGFGEDDVTCPSCGSSYLHQDSVDVWFREEGSEEARHVFTDRLHSCTDSSNENNPSRHRDGILIHFFCEECTAKPSLAIIQHKGMTLIQWQNVPEEVTCHHYGEEI